MGKQVRKIYAWTTYTDRFLTNHVVHRQYRWSSCI